MNNAATALKRYTWYDYRTWPGDERWEVIGGQAYAMSPSPTARHQMVQARLVSALDTFFRGRPCRAIPSPMDVKLSDMDVVQPDVQETTARHARVWGETRWTWERVETWR